MRFEPQIIPPALGQQSHALTAQSPLILGTRRRLHNIYSALVVVVVAYVGSNEIFNFCLRASLAGSHISHQPRQQRCRTAAPPPLGSRVFTCGQVRSPITLARPLAPQLLAPISQVQQCKQQWRTTVRPALRRLPHAQLTAQPSPAFRHSTGRCVFNFSESVCSLPPGLKGRPPWKNNNNKM